MYDPKMNTWKMLPEMNCVRSDAACVTFNNKVYVIGGFDGDQIHQSVEIYDPIHNEWSFGPQLQVPRSGVKGN